MSTKKVILLIVVPIIVIYSGFASIAILRFHWNTPPEHIALAYLTAIKNRDTQNIYSYSKKLRPNLENMMNKSDVSDEQRQQLLKDDFARWKQDFDKKSKKADNLHKEQLLLPPQVQIMVATPEEYKAETLVDGDVSLISYEDIPLEVYNRYIQLDYTLSSAAPTMGIFENIRKSKNKRIKSVVVRVEVRRRPDIGGFKAMIIDWDWIEDIDIIFPCKMFGREENPYHTWIADIGFEVDKISLKTF